MTKKFQKIEVFTPRAPRVVGPYSQAIVFGDLIFCSGQIAIDPETGEITQKGIRAQTKQVIENISSILIEAGSDLSCVIKNEIFLVNVEDFSEMNEVYAQYFSSKPQPARVTVGISKLPKNGLIEICCTAHRKL